MNEEYLGWLVKVGYSNYGVITAICKSVFWCPSYSDFEEEAIKNYLSLSRETAVPGKLAYDIIRHNNPEKIKYVGPLPFKLDINNKKWKLYLPIIM